MQMISSGICGSDDHVLKGELVVNFPLIPGHEGAGIVESVGDGVCSMKPGRKWETCDPRRRCSACTIGIDSRKTS
jgi:Zn-dependent alcohol dehydrogenase